MGIVSYTDRTIYLPDVAYDDLLPNMNFVQPTTFTFPGGSASGNDSNQTSLNLGIALGLSYRYYSYFLCSWNKYR